MTEERRAQKNAYSRKHYAKNREQELERGRRWYAVNKEKVRARHAAWQKVNSKKATARTTANRLKMKVEHPERLALYTRRNHLKRIGWSVELFEECFTQQRGLCASCSKPLVRISGKPNTACCDHDHTTGAPRGILCTCCNIALGMLDECVEKAITLAVYMIKFQKED